MSLQVLDRDTFSIVNEYKQSMEDVDNHFVNYEDVMKDIEIKNYCNQYWEHPQLKEDYFKLMTSSEQKEKYKKMSLKEMREDFEEKISDKKQYLQKTKKELKIKSRRKKQINVLKEVGLMLLFILLVIFLLSYFYRPLPFWITYYVVTFSLVKTYKSLNDIR